MLRVDYTLTEAEHVAVLRRGLRPVSALFASLLLPVGVATWWWQARLGTVAPYAVVILGAAAFPWLVAPVRVRNTIRIYPHQARPLALIADEEGLSIVRETRVTYPWGTVSRVRMISPSMALVTVGPIQIPIPRRAFADMHDFDAFLAQIEALRRTPTRAVDATPSTDAKYAVRYALSVSQHRELAFDGLARAPKPGAIGAVLAAVLLAAAFCGFRLPDGTPDDLRRDLATVMIAGRAVVVFMAMVLLTFLTATGWRIRVWVVITVMGLSGRLSKTWDVQLSPTRIRFRAERESGDLPWSSVVDVRRGDGVVFLYTSALSALIIPDSAFGDGAETAKRDIAQWYEDSRGSARPRPG